MKSVLCWCKSNNKEGIGHPTKQRSRGRTDEKAEGRRQGRAELLFCVVSFFSISSSAEGIAHFMSLMRAPHYAKRNPTEITSE